MDKNPLKKILTVDHDRELVEQITTEEIDKCLKTMRSNVSWKSHSS